MEHRSYADQACAEGMVRRYKGNDILCLASGGGNLFVRFTKPEVFIFDRFEEERNRVLTPKHSLPYSDQAVLTKAELDEMQRKHEPFEFSHTLEEQLGGQTAAGFHIVGLYEDYRNNRNF